MTTRRQTATSHARQRAVRVYRAPGFQSAYFHGALAALNGRSERACPYREDPGKTWRNTYRRAWLRGFNSVT
jgi:ribosome modulation factor